MAVNQILMTYSWHDIMPEYDNKTIKYSVDGGTNWETITFVNGMYSYTDLPGRLYYQLDFKGSKFGELISFDPNLIMQTKYGSKLPNFTNSIDVINVNCDTITDCLVDGQKSNTITVIPTDNLTRSFPFLYEPKFLSFSPVSSSTISKIIFSSGRCDRATN